MSTPNIDALRAHVNTLKKLVDDPQPGLATWCEMYGREIKWFTAFWTDEPTTEQIDRRMAEAQKALAPCTCGAKKPIIQRRCAHLRQFHGLCLSCAKETDGDMTPEQAALAWNVLVLN